MPPSFERGPKAEKIPADIEEFAELDVNDYEPDELLEDVRDILGNDFARLYIQLPGELRKDQTRKLQAYIEEQKALGRNVTRAALLANLAHFIESREQSLTEVQVSDTELQERLGTSAEKVIQNAVRQSFENTDVNAILGNGQTASVKELMLPDDERVYAMKFVVNPKPTTLDAAEEHHMLREAEQMLVIEDYERSAGVQHFFRTPHPYFAYEDKRLQGYAMERVDGIDLGKLLDAPSDSEYVRKYKEAFINRYEAKGSDIFENEIEKFLDAIHKVCLHGDLKPKNMMIDQDGFLYLIDFGQSVSALSEGEQNRAGFDRRRKEEHEKIRTIMNHLVHSAFRDTQTRTSDDKTNA